MERTVVIDSVALREIGGFLPMPRSIMRRPELSFGAKCAYAQLLAYGWEKDFAIPAQEQLADDLGLADDRQVRRLLTELRDLGLVSWRRRGQGRPNLYIVHLPDKLSGQDRTDVSGQEPPDRTDVTGLERTHVSGPSIQEKIHIEKELPGLFGEVPDKSAGSRPTRRKQQGGAKQLSWLQELNADHRTICGGDFQNFAAAGKALLPHHERLGPEFRRWWRFYLEHTEIRFISPHNFASKIAAYQPPLGWRPTRFPDQPSPSQQGGPDVSQPGSAATAADPWAESDAIAQRRIERLGVPT